MSKSPLKQPLWHVSVYDANKGKMDTYWFKQRADVLSSISLTYHKIPDTIRVTANAYHIQVHGKEDGTLHIDAVFISELDVMDVPEHF